MFPKSSRCTTSLETTFRLTSNGWRWSRSPVISRYGGEVASSRCYTSRIGRDSPNLPGSGKWTSTSPAPTSCVFGPEPRTRTAKPTACTDGCGSGRHSASSPATTGNVSYRRATPVFPAPIGSVATTTQYFLREPTFGTRETTEDKVYLVSFLHDPGPIEIPLPLARYTTLTGDVRCSWCLQVHIASEFPRGVQRNLDESRGAAVAS